MDERFRRSNSENNENLNSNSTYGRDFQQWNYSENITSDTGTDKINPSMQKPKRFEVHIPESEAFPENKIDTPTRVPAPKRRPANGTGAQTRKPVNKKAPARQAAKPSARPNAATGAKAPAKNTGAPTASAEAKKSAQRASATDKPADKSTKAPANKKNTKRKKLKADFAYNFTKNTLITCVCFIFIATLTTVVSSVAFGFINDILVIDKNGKDYSVVVEIPVGAEYDQIFEILEENGLVNQPLLTDFFLRFRHYDEQASYDDETGELLYD